MPSAGEPLACCDANVDVAESIDASDLGSIKDLLCLSTGQIEKLVRQGPTVYSQEVCAQFAAIGVPLNFFVQVLTTNEAVSRDWLQWSMINQSFYCFPCRLFSQQPKGQKALFASCTGYTGSDGVSKWKKMWDRVPIHDKAPDHLKCSIQWRNLLQRLNSN